MSGTDKILQFTSRYQESHAQGFPENGGGPQFSILRQPKTADVEQLTLGLSYQQQVNPEWIYGFDFDLFSRQQNSNVPAILDALPPSVRAIPPLRGRSNFRRLRLGFTSRLRLSPKLSLNLGARARDEQGSDDTLIADQFPSSFELQRQTVAGNGEVLYRSGRLTMTLGGRLDKSEGFEVELSPRAGLVVSLADRTRLKTSWGKGFKLPSFYALGQPHVGNPQLHPERSRGFDISLEHTLAEFPLHLSWAVFHNAFRNLIDFSPELFQLVNRSQATTRGVEFGMTLPLKETWRLGTHLQFLDWKLQGTSEPLRDRPRWRGGAHLEWRIHPGVQLRWETLWVGDRFDFQLPVPDQQTVEGYSISSLVLNYQLPHGLLAYGRIDNLFDSAYQEFIGFPNPGIYARLGLRYRILGR